MKLLSDLPHLATHVSSLWAWLWLMGVGVLIKAGGRGAEDLVSMQVDSLTGTDMSDNSLHMDLMAIFLALFSLSF